MNNYRSALTMMLVAAASLAFGPPGSAAERMQFVVPTKAPAVLRFVAIDPARGAIDQEWLLKEITAALQARSDWPLSSSGKATTELSGLRTRLDEDQSQIVFEYVHVDRNRFGEEWGETLTIPVPYQVEKTGVLFIIRLGPPGLADFVPRRTPGVSFLPVPKLAPVMRLFDDFSAIMDGAETLELHHAFLLLGQLEAAASPQSCIEKFDYALGRYAYAKNEERVFDAKHDDIFLFRTAAQSIPLKIAALEHGSGSRIFYEAWVPFELRADGTVLDYDLPTVVSAEVDRVLRDVPTRDQDAPTWQATTRQPVRNATDDIHVEASFRQGR
jgi:hypothetical protein